MEFIYDLIQGYPFELWARRLRLTQTPLQFQDSMMFRAAVQGDTQYHSYGAPTQDGADLTAFAQLHAESLSSLPTNPAAVFDGALADAVAQLWRNTSPPSSFAVDFVSDSQPRLTWINQHRGRSADSTEIYRRVNGGSWELRQAVEGTTTSFTDGPLTSGTYGYFVRHVTALATVVNDVGALARPASATTEAITVATGAPPPTGLLCEGNFGPTIDCRWWRAVASAPSEILRGGVVKASASGGAVNTLVQWTDSAVTSGQSYSYQVRHVVSGAPGRISLPPHSGAATPVAPENLGCAGTEEGVISCVWVDKEPDTVAVERKTSTGDWTYIANVLANEMFFSESGLSQQQYCYRARHRRGTAFTPYSNSDCAIPGDGGPLRP